MQTAPLLPLTRDLVLVGGGHAHALALLRWAMRPLPGVRLTLVNPAPSAPYTGMLPGHIAGHYPLAALEMDLVQLARHAGARLVLDRAVGLDPAAGLVHLSDRPAIAYDIASLDIGITSALPELPGFAEHAVAAKPLGGYAARWESFVAAVRSAKALPEVVVIGAGVGGVELSLAMAHRLAGHPGTRVSVLEAGPSALPGVGPGARARLLRQMAQQGVALHCNAKVVSITADAVLLDDGTKLPAGLVLGAAGSRPQPWLAETGLHLTEGYVTVGPDLRSTSHPEVFAVGDCAHMAHAPRPKAGVYAVRQAPVLYHNLQAALGGGALRAYKPQRDYLKLVSLGGKSALADKWNLPLQGRWLWQLKDRIDRKFMRMFHELPAMPTPRVPPRAALGMAEELAGGKPQCGGCGAKMGAATLQAALASLPATGRDDVELGAGDDAAVLLVGGQRQVITTDHLRSFIDDPYLMARIAAIHALGDIWAMGASPQAALATVILPRMSASLQGRSMAEVMAGAASVLAPLGAELVGGHSATGAEMTIGFTMTGLAGGRSITKSGARPGDALVLTKPLGSGTILAAEMLKSAPGSDYAAALALMLQPQALAAEILAPVARAMTDVTGFGLAGHLGEICAASGCAARLDLAEVPFMPGALALAAAGHASSLAPANRAATAALLDAPDTAETWLLNDPQTAGGLLASVPGDAAESLVRTLVNAGYSAALIGWVEEGPVRIIAR